MSVRQGEEVSEYLAAMGLPWNKAWAGNSAEFSSSHDGVQLAGGMLITVLSPRRVELQRLAGSWQQELARSSGTKESRSAGFTAAVPAAAERAHLEAKAPDSMDVDALANSRFIGDKSVANASSIAFLAEFHHRAVLVGGDARAEVLCESIASLLARRKKTRLRLDAFVVPHAGSKGNLNRELLALLDCDRYLVSTDGRVFNHPDRETIARIITYGRASNDRQPTLVFNYRSSANEMWASPDLQRRYGYIAVYPEPGTAGIKVQL
jgi:hypothetical protein